MLLTFGILYVAAAGATPPAADDIIVETLVAIVVTTNTPTQLTMARRLVNSIIITMKKITAIFNRSTERMAEKFI